MFHSPEPPSDRRQPRRAAIARAAAPAACPQQSVCTAVRAPSQGRAKRVHFTLDAGTSRAKQQTEGDQRGTSDRERSERWSE